MAWQRYIRITIPSILLGFIVFTYQGCGIERPRVGNNATLRSISGGFDHTGITANCAICHQKDFPANHSPTGGADCSSCHVTTGWLDGAVDPHNPVPASCNLCHSSGMTYDPYIKNPGLPPHRLTDDRDCKSCHSVPTGTTAWLPADFPHSPVPNACAVCHQPDYPTNHIPIQAGQDCVDCHLVDTWKGVDPHVPVPKNCAQCHDSGRVQDRYTAVAGTHVERGTNDCVSCHKVGDVMADWKNNATFGHTPPPTECASCHGPGKANDPYKIYAGLPPHRPQNGLDCISCHQPGTVVADWRNTAKYAHSPVPASCNACHEFQRPTKQLRIEGNTINDHFKNKDCFACHRVGTAFNFDESGHKRADGKEVGFCLPCHYNEGWQERDIKEHRNKISFEGDGNCQECHGRKSKEGF